MEQEQTKKKIPASALFHNANYTLYFLGILVSQCGNVLSNFATNLFLLDLFGTAAPMSAYLAMNIAVTLALSPIMGVWADRLNKVKVLYLCDFLFGVTELLLAALLFLTEDRSLIVTGIFINGFCNSIASALYSPTSTCMVPLVVEEKEQMAAYSYLSTMQETVNILGMLLAAGAFSLLGYKWILIINGISFVFSAISEIFIKIKDVPKKETEHPFKEEFVSGFQYLWKDKALINLILCGVLMNIFLCGMLDIVVPFMLNTKLQLEPIVLASTDMVFSIGCILAGAWLSQHPSLRIGRAFVTGQLLFFASYVILCANYFAFASGLYNLVAFWGILIGAFLLMGFSLCRMNILTQTTFASRTDKEYLGRTAGVRSTLGRLSLPFAMLIFAALIDHVSVGFSAVVAAAGVLLTALYAAGNRHIRKL